MFHKLVIVLGFIWSCVTPKLAYSDPLQTVAHVDIPKYMGVWYEIASFPQRYTKDCVNSSATYTLRDDGKVNVVNQCNKGSATGPQSSVKGVARVVNQETNAELKVSFFWPFEGDYWIVDLGAQYEFAVVSAPDRDTLWILSRTEQLSPDVQDGILDRLKTVHGFDLSRLKFTRE